MVTERRRSLTGGGILFNRKTEIYLLQEIDATTAHGYFQQCHAQQQEHNVWVKEGELRNVLNFNLV